MNIKIKFFYCIVFCYAFLLQALPAAPLDSLIQELQLADGEQDLERLTLANLNLGSYYLEQHTPDKALPFLLTALDKAGASYDLDQLLVCNQYLATCYENLGNYKKANAFLLAFKKLKERKLSTQALTLANAKKNKQSEIAKKDQEIEALKTRNELLTKTKEVWSLRLALLICSILTLALITYLIYKRKQDKQLEALKFLQKDKLIAEQHQKIKAQLEELYHSNAELEQFAYIASHDLKEPLRTIKSYSDLLRRYHPELAGSASEEFLNFIIDAVSRMDSLLEELLTYSRVGRKNQEIHPVQTDRVVESVAASLYSQIEQKDARIRMGEEMPVVMANKVQLGQLFKNLISNALKFQKEGQPVVEVDCKSKHTNYIFSIKDNGIGIAPEYKEKVFEMFRRLHTRTEFEGTGIGLATCKKIVEGFGGEIWVESEIGQGSTFYFTIPRAVTEN